MGGGGAGGAPAAAEPMEEENVGNLAAMTEEEQIALAIQMSMAESAGPEGTHHKLFFLDICYNYVCGPIIVH